MWKNLRYRKGDAFYVTLNQEVFFGNLGGGVLKVVTNWSIINLHFLAFLDLLYINENNPDNIQTTLNLSIRYSFRSKFNL